MTHRTCSVSAHTRTLPERRPSVQLAMTERLRREVSIIQAIAQVEAAVFVWGSEFPIEASLLDAINKDASGGMI